MKKKIAFFVMNMYKFGGIQKVVSLISNELVKENEITIISLFKNSDELPYELNKKIKVIYIYDKILDIRKSFFKIKNRLKKELKKYNFDIFINCGMGYVPLNLFIRKKSTYISWEHSNCMIGKKYGITWLGRYLSNKYADYIIFLTKKDMNNFHRLFKCKDNNKLIQIYNPISISTKSDKYDDKSTKILSCGRLENQKGFDMLIDIAKMVFSNKQTEDWTWDIYGDGSQKEFLKNKIMQENLENKIILKGNVNNMEEMYKYYSFFVLTSRYEGLGMVNIEASSNLLPIVSFNCNCGPDEIILNDVNGYIVECFDKKEMAEKILDLIENKDKRIMFSSKSGLYKDKLSLNYVLQQWKNLIEKCGEDK